MRVKASVVGAAPELGCQERDELPARYRACARRRSLAFFSTRSEVRQPKASPLAEAAAITRIPTSPNTSIPILTPMPAGGGRSRVRAARRPIRADAGRFVGCRDLPDCEEGPGGDGLPPQYGHGWYYRR